MVSYLAGVLGLGIAGVILWLVRMDRLHVQHGVGWIFLAVAFSGAGFAPRLVDWLALQLGIHYPPVIGLVLGFSSLVIKVLLMDIERSKAVMRTERLVQRVAMLEHDLRCLQGSIDSSLVEIDQSSDGDSASALR